MAITGLRELRATTYPLVSCPINLTRIGMYSPCKSCPDAKSKRAVVEQTPAREQNRIFWSVPFGAGCYTPKRLVGAGVKKLWARSKNKSESVKN